jgi:TRAP-type mannitol/chloroaromatic compound transport system permease small subunit
MLKIVCYSYAYISIIHTKQAHRGSPPMNALLKFSSLVDKLNEKIGLIANWLVLIACVISAGNAVMRKGFDLSSNAWLEIQWYLFAGMVMLGASYTLKMNEHVRVDVFYSRYSDRTRLWVDLIGGILFLLPMAIIIGWLSWPLFINSYQIGEMSGNSGGLLRWPVKILIPIGFFLLTLQGMSEVIKRAAALMGYVEINARYERPLQ